MNVLACPLTALSLFASVMQISAAPAHLSVPPEEVTRALKEGSVLRLSGTVGTTFTFSLNSNPTTGYRWVLSGECGVARVHLDFTAPVPMQENRPRLMGAPGRENVTITALRPGIGNMTLLCARPWEKPSRSAQILRIELHVADPERK